VQSGVCLETVAAVPITTTLYQCVCAVDGLLRQYPVAEEERDAYYGKDEVDLGA
jgi:hypothetical protein